MQPIHQLFGSAIPMFANMVILFYVCQRFLAATRLRRKIMNEMREFATIVGRARDNLRYIGEQVTKGMEEIREDVGKELRVTDRLTTQSASLAAVLRRFETLEENVIEMLPADRTQLVRMDRNRESVRIETPADVSEEIQRIVTAAERRRNQRQYGQEIEKKLEELRPTREQVRDSGPRNPLSKFSACGPRETAVVDAVNGVARKTTDGRTRIATTPEVRLLGESNRPFTGIPAESRRESHSPK